jgi:hypothetical protein
MSSAKPFWQRRTPSIDRKTSVFLSDATAAFATTKATVALSVLSFELASVMQNFPAMSRLLFACGRAGPRRSLVLFPFDPVAGRLKPDEPMPREPAPGGQVLGRAVVGRTLYGNTTRGNGIRFNFYAVMDF